MPVGFRRLPPSPAHPRRVVGLTANCAGRSKDLRSTTTGPMKPTSSPPRRSTPASTQVPPQASQKATNPSPTTRTPSLLAPAPALAGRFAVSTKGKGGSSHYPLPAGWCISWRTTPAGKWYSGGGAIAHFSSGPCCINSTSLCSDVVRPGEGKDWHRSRLTYVSSREFLVHQCPQIPSATKSVQLESLVLKASMCAFLLMLAGCHNW